MMVGMLEHFSTGNYRYLDSPGRPFSAGVVADRGFDLVHATLLKPLPLDRGLEAARQHLEQVGRPAAALAAFELRIAQPLSRQGFDDFNAAYVARLRAIGVSAGEKLPAARTNVAPTASRIEEPSLYAFTYTLPGDREGPAFVLSGAPETDRTSTEAKLLSILAVLDGRLDALGTTWEHCTATNFYGSALPAESAAVFQRLGSAAVHGVHWYPSLPPVTPLEYEIDARGTSREITI